MNSLSSFSRSFTSSSSKSLTSSSSSSSSLSDNSTFLSLVMTLSLSSFGGLNLNPMRGPPSKILPLLLLLSIISSFLSVYSISTFCSFSSSYYLFCYFASITLSVKLRSCNFVWHSSNFSVFTSCGIESAAFVTTIRV